MESQTETDDALKGGAADPAENTAVALSLEIPVAPVPVVAIQSPGADVGEKSASDGANTHHRHHHHHHALAHKVEPLLTPEQVHQQKILRLKAGINTFIESTPVVITMSIITIWALFSDDIRLAATMKDADLGFEVVISICFFMFLSEIILASYAKGQEYLYIPDQTRLPKETAYQSFIRRIKIGSFYFWLDLIATISLIFEIHWIVGDSLTTGAQSAKGGNAARAGSRAGRIVRLVRMVRLIRMVRLYKYASSAMKDKVKDAVIITDEGEMVLPPQSKVGAALTDLTNRRVIILVLVILIIVPNLMTSEDDTLTPTITQTIDRMARGFYFDNASNFKYTLEQTIAFAVTFSLAKTNIGLLRVQTEGAGTATKTWHFDSERFNELRTVEREVLIVYDKGFTTTCWFDVRYQSKTDASFATYTTLFIIIILVVGTLFFSSDVQRLVIGPIEKMVELVQKISANPLGVEYKMLGEDEGFGRGMETTVLLTTIVKIGALMRVGFGEAGADVIARNLAGDGGKLNLMEGGQMITSIFGFCDVRQFTDTTECLQEEVMLFVNRIAHILHNIVVQCSGSANKNIGDAFLLTWKVREKLAADDITHLADSALYAFLKTLVELNRYATFICNFSIAATQRLYKRFPGYNVRIGSGLHVGWAIEGAIGSHRKIDASYLSPHVNFTEFLESSTKAYGVPLLLSEPFYKLLSPEAKSFIRQVDRIKKSEKDEPMGLYAYDADLEIDFADASRVRKHVAHPRAPSGAAGLKQKMASKLLAHAAKAKGGPGGPQPTGHNQSHNVAGVALKGLAAKKAKEKADHDAAEKRAHEEKMRNQPPVIATPPYNTGVWTTDEDLMELRHMVGDKFRSIWNDGINAYIKGDWRKARDIFHETSKMGERPDGPSQFLIELIDHHGGTAPSDWKGYREEGAGGH